MNNLMNNTDNIQNIIDNYKNNYLKTFNKNIEKKIHVFSKLIENCWRKNNTIYIIGNGGSGANALHIANDFLYGAGLSNKKGIKVEALVSNSSVITCLANDTDYESIFSEQIRVKANKNDLLLVLSGSGNSKNIIKAIKIAKKMKVNTFGILGYSGGKAKKLLDNCIHFELNDMQIVEDLQMFVCHVCCKWLSKIKLDKNK